MANSVRIACPDDSKQMQDQTFCLDSISKDLEGEAGEPKGEQRQCAKPECITLLTVQSLRLEVQTHRLFGCDSPLGKLLDGVLAIEELVHVYNGDGTDRGFHSGEFRWEADGTLLVGQLSGITNAGTHRGPAFDDSQRCKAPGFLEGRFCGAVQETSDEQLTGAQVFGAYRLRFEASDQGIAAQALAGTLEGLVIRRCSE